MSDECGVRNAECGMWSGGSAFPAGKLRDPSGVGCVWGGRGSPGGKHPGLRSATPPGLKRLRGSARTLRRFGSSPPEGSCTLRRPGFSTPEGSCTLAPGRRPGDPRPKHTPDPGGRGRSRRPGPAPFHRNLRDPCRGRLFFFSHSPRVCDPGRISVTPPGSNPTPIEKKKF